MTEQAIQKKIIEYLHSLGGYVIKTIITNRAGNPDLICCLRGKFLALEVKTEKGKISKLQEYKIEHIKRAGGVAGIVRSVDDVKELISNSKILL